MEAAQFQMIARALADPRRFEILELIAEQGEKSCGEIVECFKVRQPTISHHLRELSLAGLVEVRHEGQFNYYRVQTTALQAFFAECRHRLRIETV